MLKYDAKLDERTTVRCKEKYLLLYDIFVMGERCLSHVNIRCFCMVFSWGLRHYIRVMMDWGN